MAWRSASGKTRSARWAGLARGVRAMELRKGDYLVGVAAVEEDGLILSISENGYGKRRRLREYRLTGRGCKGVINMKITPKIGKVVEVFPVKESTDLMIITRNGQIIRLESDHIRRNRPLRARCSRGQNGGRR